MTNTTTTIRERAREVLSNLPLDFGLITSSDYDEAMESLLQLITQARESMRQECLAALPEGSKKCYNCGTNPCEYTSTGCPVWVDTMNIEEARAAINHLEV